MIRLRPLRAVRWGIAPATAIALAACDATAPKSLTVSITTNSMAPAAARFAASGPSADLQIGSGANSLKITSVQLVLAKIELASAAPCSGTSGEPGCEELEVGPVLVDVPLNGTITAILDAAVPAGTFTSLEAKLDAVQAGEPGVAAFLAAHPAFAGVSVRVVGVFTDANAVDHPFTFTSGVDAEIEIQFQAPVTVGTGTSNLTIAVAVPSWFKDASGAVIDPTNAANAPTIEANIEHSFEAFEDDNRDGLPDPD
jgi:hypothetical protein